MKKKLYCFFTPSHESLFNDYLKPSAEKEYDINYLFYKNQICESGEYSESGWRETQYNKVLYWIDAVKKNYQDVIVCCDVDVQFLKPSFELLVQALGSGDIAFQCNDSSGNICSGFVICKCNDKTLSFLKETAAILKGKMRQDGGGEQYVMRDILFKDSCDLNWAVIPRSIVWCPSEKYNALSALKVNNSLVAHHANWTNGVDEKIKQLDYIRNRFNQGSLAEKQSRIALCSSSLLRNLGQTYENLIEKIIKPLPEAPDFFGFFTDKCETEENKRYLNEIKKHCNSMHIEFKEDIIDETLCDLSDGLNRFQRHGLRGNILQWQSMKKVKELKCNFENFHGMTYECVIWTRPDLYFFNSLDNILNLKFHEIYNSAHDNHLHGICDRFSLGSSEAMDSRMTIIDSFREWFFNHKREDTFFSKKEQRFMWNPEVFYRDYLEICELNHGKLNLCFGKSRENGEVKIPFWHEISGNSNSGHSCSEDIINPEVLKTIKDSEDLILDKYGNWMTVKMK